MLQWYKYYSNRFLKSGADYLTIIGTIYKTEYGDIPEKNQGILICFPVKR